MIFIQENESENVICKMADTAKLTGPRTFADKR